MLLIKKIHGIWAVVNDQEIIECFDTKYEADEYFEPERQKQALVEFDKSRNWISLWDEEKISERKNENWM